MCDINIISFGDFFRDCQKYLIAFQLCLNTGLTFFECNSWLRWSPGQLGSVELREQICKPILTVTEQIGAHPSGNLVHDLTISVERNRFLFTIFQPWGWGREYFSSEPCSPTRPITSLAPQKAISQKPSKPEVPYFLI